MVEIHHGDMRVVLRAMALTGRQFHACVTDPPYHLTSVVKRFGAEGAAPARSNGPTGVYARASRGFMGKTWDGGDIAFRPETWRAVYDVLLPGAHLLAFGGTRTWHRLACAIEDAGFEIRDTLMWVYGSGFPKSHNQTGAWAGWGTALKPAWEPIILARKPLDGTITENVLAHGTGALNIDGCRVPFADEADERESKDKNRHADFGSGPRTNRIYGQCSKDRGDYDAPGRWPANVVHDGSKEVEAAFAAFGERQAGAHPARRAGLGSSRTLPSTSKGTCGERVTLAPGSAARFFYCAKASRRDREEGCEALGEKPLLWSADTHKAARNNHPTVKPESLMRWLVRLVTPPGGIVLDPFAGSGSTGKACALEGFGFVGVELDPEYVPIAHARIAHALRRSGAARDAAPLAMSLL